MNNIEAAFMMVKASPSGMKETPRNIHIIFNPYSTPFENKNENEASARILLYKFLPAE